METKYGARFRVSPPNHFNEDQKPFSFHEYQLSISNGELEVGCENINEFEKIGDIAHQFINAFNFENGTILSIERGHDWQPQEGGGRLLSMTLNESITVTDRIITHSVTLEGKARIIKKIYDSNDLSNQIGLVTKAQNYEPLKLALKYYGEEAIGSERPLYGIYKALEVLSDSLGKGGWEKLGKLAGKDKKFISDVTQTAQVTRHRKGYQNVQQVITDDECRDRAKLLIKAYSDSL